MRRGHIPYGYKIENGAAVIDEEQVAKIKALYAAYLPRDIFMQVKEEMVRRANITTGTGKRRVYSGH